MTSSCHTAVFACCMGVLGWTLGCSNDHGKREMDIFITLSDVLRGCWHVLTIAMDVLCGHFSMNPNNKKQPLSCHILRLPQWHKIHRICISFILEEYIWIKSGGSINCRVLFLFGTLLEMADWRWMHSQKVVDSIQKISQSSPYTDT